MYWIAQTLNGLSFGMLLFLLASGLTVTLGVMRVINLTHGSFYLLGGYCALTMTRWSGSFSLGLIFAIGVVVISGGVVFALLRLAHANPLQETLLTFGLLFVIADISLALFGGSTMSVPKPGWLSGPVHLGAFDYPAYRLALIVVGAAVAIGLELLQRKTLAGAIVRAVVDDQAMAQALGRNARVVAGGTFIVGAAFAGLAGVLGGATLGIYPGADLDVLLLAFIVVIVGGMGSLTGSLIGALLVGLLDTFGRAIVPELGASLMFLLMLIVLAFKPAGLFGAKT